MNELKGDFGHNLRDSLYALFLNKVKDDFFWEYWREFRDPLDELAWAFRSPLRNELFQEIINE